MRFREVFVFEILLFNEIDIDLKRASDYTVYLTTDYRCLTLPKFIPYLNFSLPPPPSLSADSPFLISAYSPQDWSPPNSHPVFDLRPPSR